MPFHCSPPYIVLLTITESCNILILPQIINTAVRTSCDYNITVRCKSQVKSTVICNFAFLHKCREELWKICTSI
nr:MAG TPA: hypothetical protein [Caudoviricetes sp.]